VKKFGGFFSFFASFELEFCWFCLAVFWVSMECWILQDASGCSTKYKITDSRSGGHKSPTVIRLSRTNYTSNKGIKL
jgi:hypothetical protein